MKDKIPVNGRTYYTLSLINQYLSQTINTDFDFGKDNRLALDIKEKLLQQPASTLKKTTTDDISGENQKTKQATAPQPSSKVGAYISLTEIKEAVKTCQLCSLAVRRKEFIDFGEKNNSIMFITDIPGYYDEVQGRIFADRTSELFDNILKALNLTRKDIYLSACIKCASNKEPGAELGEYLKCRRYIESEIKLVDPKIIIGLGEVCMRFFFPDKNFKIERGRNLQLFGYNCFFTYNPKDLLFAERLKKPTWEDLKRHLL